MSGESSVGIRLSAASSLRCTFLSDSSLALAGVSALISSRVVTPPSTKRLAVANASVASRLAANKKSSTLASTACAEAAGVEAEEAVASIDIYETYFHARFSVIHRCL